MNYFNLLKFKQNIFYFLELNIHQQTQLSFIRLIKLSLLFLSFCFYYCFTFAEQKNSCTKVFTQTKLFSQADMDKAIDSMIALQIQRVSNSPMDQSTNDLKSSSLKATEIMNRAIDTKLFDELNKLQIHFGKDAIELYYHKLKQRIPHLRKHKNEFDKPKKIYEIKSPQYWQEKLRFHKIEPGIFMMGEPGKQVPVEIKDSFEMMATLVTQQMWEQLMLLIGKTQMEDIYPSYYSPLKIDHLSQEQITGPDMVGHMLKHHPVEYIPLSILRGVTNPSNPPLGHSILHQLNVLSNSGNDNIQQQLRDLMPGHQKGDIYDIPTDAQWEYVMTNLGKNPEFLGIKGTDMGDDFSKHSWDASNSNDHTQIVALKQPRIVDDNLPFYDLEGNVFELTKDWSGSTANNGKSPNGDPRGYSFIVRGGSYRKRVNRNREYKDTIDHVNTQAGFEYVGIRLTRTRK